jgi:hypothetical protein
MDFLSGFIWCLDQLGMAWNDMVKSSIEYVKRLHACYNSTMLEQGSSSRR